MSGPRKRCYFLLVNVLVVLVLLAPPAMARERFKVAWTLYVGWMPWELARAEGIVDKWAARYGIEIEVVQVAEYIDSIERFAAGEFDACTMTNIDALTLPAAMGTDSTALIVGDFSNGNDAVVLKRRDDLRAIKGLEVGLVQYSVSHYLLHRALGSVGLRETDIRLKDTSDAVIDMAFAMTDMQAIATWNPQLNLVMGLLESNKVFDSSQIPGEIIDLTVVNTRTLQENPDLGRALVGAWYETMALMSRQDSVGRNARAYMGEASGSHLVGYESQLASTRMFYDAGEATRFATDRALVETMDKVRRFSAEAGLLDSPETVGIAFPDGSVLGNRDNIKLRFDNRYMQLAADDALLEPR
ncbi:MAG: lipid kinase [Chromatiales bacterium]|nr:lipid kinase [Chromatiales bacterium]